MMILITKLSAVFLFLDLIAVNAKTTLHLGAMISQEGGIDLSGYIPAMNLALETIKNDTTLPFNFNIRLSDSMVSCLVTMISIAIIAIIAIIATARLAKPVDSYK